VSKGKVAKSIPGKNNWAEFRNTPKGDTAEAGGFKER
jgi:hypothetical protein